MRTIVATVIVRSLLLLLVITVLCVGWFLLVFVYGSRSTRKPGGSWLVEHVQFPDSHGYSGKLSYDTGDGRLHYASPVITYNYYGDNCIGFTEARPGQLRLFFACGYRSALLISSDIRSSWDFEADAIQEYYVPVGANTFERVKGRTLSVTNLKAAAVRLPSLARR